MRKAFGWVIVLVFIVPVGLPARPRRGKSKSREARLLYMTLSAGYKHATVAPSEAIVRQIGERSGLFQTTVTQDVSAFMPENLKKYDVVMFYTTGELPMNETEKRAFIDFIRSGHGFVGVHSATDTFYMWKDYGDMIGAYFNDHPWHQKVTVDVVAPSDPIVSFLGKSFQVNDEIYQFSDFKADTTHVLLKLDTSTVDLKNPRVRQRYYGFPLAWTRRYGKGRVFYLALGHEDAVWNSQWYQTLLLNGIKYAMGRMK
jgi:uncharacterized protein